MSSSKILNLKTLFFYLIFLCTVYTSLPTLAATSEFYPYDHLNKTQLGLALLDVEKSYQNEASNALERLNFLKKSEGWVDSSTTIARYYSLKLKILSRLSASTEIKGLIEEFRQFANSTDIEWLVLESNYHRADAALINDGDNNTTLELINRTLPKAIEINFQHLVNRLYNLRAIAKQNSGDNSGALKDFHLALNNPSSYQNEGWAITIYSNMSIIYLEIEDYAKGLEINDLAFELFKEEKIENDQIETSLLIMKALFLKNTHDYEQAIKTFYQAENSAIKSGLINLILNVKSNLSGALLADNKANEAKKVILECIADSVQHSLSSTLSYCQSNLAHIEIELGNYSEAITLLKQAKSSFEKKNNLKAAIQQQLSLSVAYERSGDYYTALQQLKKYYEQNIDLMFNERTKEISRIEEAFEAQLKDKQIALLKAKNELQSARLRENTLTNQLIIIISIFSIIFLLYFIRNYIKIKKQTVFLEKSNATLLDNSFIDPLTKVGNRRALAEYIKMLAGNTKNIEHYVVILDIDHFKNVNDTYGHMVGDEILGVVANRLSAETRDKDKLVRWGGEEFVLVIAGENKDNKTSVANRIIKTISSKAITTSVGEIRVTVSAGATNIKPGQLNKETWPEVLKKVDSALYIAKEGGRNQAVLI